MTFPTEIMAGPVDVFIAPAGTAFTSIGVATPSAPWIVLGSTGALNTDEDGVTVTSSIDTDEFTPLGDIHPVKSWLTGEDLRVQFTLADLRLETLSHALGGPATAAGNVQTVANGGGLAGYKWLSLTRSSVPAQVAMMVRGTQSPYDDAALGWRTQFELYRVSQVAAVPLAFQKGTPTKVAFEYRIYRDASGVGRIVAQNAVVA